MLGVEQNMSKFELGGASRLAVTAGLGLALTLGVAPAVALAEPTGVQEAIEISQDEGISLFADQETHILTGEGTEASPYIVGSLEDLQAALSSGGFIKLNGEISGNVPEGKSTLLSVPATSIATLDLNGHSIAVSGASGQGITNSGNLTIVDSSAEQDAVISGGMITLANLGVLSLDGIAVSNNNAGSIGVFNLNSLIVDNCKMSGETPLYITGKNGDTVMSNKVTATISNTDVTSGEAQSFWGVAVFGKGVDENVAFDNSAVSVTMAKCKVSSTVGGQGICTNASSGKYAGFTLQVSDTTVDMGSSAADGCGMYLPGIGNTVLDNCVISGAQGIRIAAGELQITNGTSITGTAAMGEDDLVQGGSGGTLGALVVGKAGKGYLGDVKVTVDASSKLANSAVEGEGSVCPAVVVSDKNMASAYASNTIDVSIAGNVDGDVVKTSTIDNAASAEGDGGSTILDITGSAITGNVFNQSATSVSLKDVTLTGNVVNSSAGSIGIVGSTITGTISQVDQATGSVVIADSTVNSNGEENAIGEGVTVINTKVNGIPTTSENVTAAVMLNGAAYDSFGEAFEKAQAGDTIELIKDIQVSAAIEGMPAGVTVDGNGHSISLAADLANGGVINVTNGNVTLKDLKIYTLGKAKYGVQFYCCADGVLSECKIYGGHYASVNVNLADVTFDEVELNPEVVPYQDTDNAPAYANIDFSMPRTSQAVAVLTVPKLDIVDIAYNSDVKLVHVDADSQLSMAKALGIAEDDATALTSDQVSQLVADLNKNALSGVTLYVGEDGSLTNIKPYTPPVTPPNPVTPAGEEVTITETAGGKIEVDPERAEKGDTVTVTATAEEGKLAWSVSVTDEDGKAIEVKPGEKDGAWTFEMPDGPVTVEAKFVCDGEEACPSHSLSDVEVGAWYHDVVDWAVENGIMTGYEGSGKFGPDDALTRAQLASTLYKAAGCPEVSDADLAAIAAYTDVDATAWYANAIAWAKAEGIMTGYSNCAAFGPDDILTREQLAVVFWRTAGEPVAEGDAPEFPDASDTSDWAGSAVDWAVSTGLLQGYSDSGKLDPLGDLTRAQMAAVMYRQAEDAE